MEVFDGSEVEAEHKTMDQLGCKSDDQQKRCYIRRTSTGQTPAEDIDRRRYTERFSTGEEFEVKHEQLDCAKD